VVLRLHGNAVSRNIEPSNSEDEAFSVVDVEACPHNQKIPFQTNPSLGLKPSLPN